MQLPTTSSSYGSDTDDMYGFDTDDLPPSSDSELVSQPSDNEDTHQSLSASSSPAHSATYPSGPHTDNDDDLPSFLLTSQDLNPDHQRRARRDLDDFYLVEPSDADSLSRPQSSLSRHSDHDRETDSMGLIYPSMTVSSLGQPFTHEQDSNEHLHSPLDSLLSHANGQGDQQPDGEVEDDDEEELQDDHRSVSFWGEPSFHEAPSAADSSMDTITGIPPQMADSEITSSGKAQRLFDKKATFAHAEMEELFPITGPITLDTAQDTKTTELPLPPPPPPPPRKQQEQLESEVVTKSEVIYQRLSSPSTGDVVTRKVPQEPPSRRMVIEPCWIGWMIILSFAGFIYLNIGLVSMTVEYFNPSSRLAHALIDEIHYDGRNQLAVLRLDVLTANFKRKKWSSNRPSAGFHVRVLNDSKPWSFEEAPEQMFDLFSEIFVTELSAGPYEFGVVPLLTQPIDPQLDSTSPRPADHCIPYPQHYWHVWFANGTRVPGTPVGVFKGKLREDQGWPCFLEIPNTGKDGENYKEGDDYLSYLKSQWYRMSGNISARLSSSRAVAWLDIDWSRMWPMLTEVPNMMDTALIHIQQTIRLIHEWIIRMASQLFKSGDQVLERTSESLKRAKENARVITGQAGHRLDTILGRLNAKMGQKGSDKSNFKDKLDRRWLKVKTVLKESASKVPTQRFLEKAEELFEKSERKVESVMQNEFVKGVGQKLNKKLEDLQSSRTGHKVVQEAKFVKKETARRLSMLKERLASFS